MDTALHEKLQDLLRDSTRDLLVMRRTQQEIMNNLKIVAEALEEENQ